MTIAGFPVLAGAVVAALVGLVSQAGTPRAPAHRHFSSAARPASRGVAAVDVGRRDHVRGAFHENDARYAVPPDTVTVTIREFQFQPSTVTVRAGDVVVWQNADEAVHTIAADSADFESPLIMPGQELSIQFTLAGTFAYHCLPHPFMKAVIHVREAAP